MNRLDGFVIAGLALGSLVVLLLMGGPSGFSLGMDFNQAPLEDWMGPFFSQAQAVLAGEYLPVEGFLYPPSAAVLMAPMGWLSPVMLAWVGLGLQLISMVAMALLVVRLGNGSEHPVDLILFGLATAFCYPLLHSVHWGQMGAPMAALCALSLLLWQKGRGGGAALVLAVATGVKFYPGILWLVRLLAGRLARVDWIAGCAVLILLPLLVMGGEAGAFAEQMWARLQEASHAGGAWAGSINRQGFPLVLGRALGSAEAGWIELGLAWAILLGALFYSKHLMRREGMLMGAGLLLACLPLLPGPCWPHHLATLPICWWLAGQRGSCAMGLVVLSATLGSLPAFLMVGGWPTGLSLGLPALSALAAGLAFGVPRTTESQGA